MRKWKLIIFFISISYSLVFAQEDSVKLLQKAYKRGEIDYQTALNYKLYAIFNKKKLPKAYQSDVLLKSATPIILEAKQNRHLLFKENEFILQRPIDSSDADYYGDDITVWTYNSPGGNFKIHYTENNTNGDAVYGYDGNQTTIPQYVIDLAEYLDNSWTQIITNMGYTAPPSDGTAGGDCKVDVYLLNMDAYGYIDYETCSQSVCTVYLVIENDFTGFPENLDSDQRQGSQKVTAAHEFFHASQFQYTTNISVNAWWMEATATWMEDVVYPSVKDYLNYVGFKYDDTNDNGQWDSGETYYEIDGITPAGTTGRPSKRWFDHPEYSLDSTQDTHAYGTIIWAKYFSKTYGNSIIKSIYQRICSSGATALTAISDELAAQGTSLSIVFKDFHEANYKRDYPDGNYYPIIWHEATYTTDIYTLSVSPDNYLSTKFYAFKPQSQSSTLTLTFNNMNTGEIAVRLLLQKIAGGYDEMDVNLNSPSVTEQISGYGSTYSKVIAIIMNTYSPSSYSAGTSCIENNTNPCGNSGGGDGGCCFIATAVYGSYLSPEVQVLRKLRDKWLISNFEFRISNFQIRIPNVLGRALVHYYYKFSPPIANYIKRHEALKTVVRLILTPMIYGIKYPVYSLIVILGFASVVILITSPLDRVRLFDKI